MLETIHRHLALIRDQRPLIVNITNVVTMDFIANGLACVGASPVMSQAIEEIDALVQLSAAVVVNIGTLNDSFLALANRACAAANTHQKPLVLDPVGVGATAYRTQAAQQLLSTYQVQLIRGNASEIAALSGADVMTKGVDSVLETDEVVERAQLFAQANRTTLCLSGAADIIVDETRMAKYSHGSPLMPQVVGTGCLLSAVMGAFLAVEADPFKAASAAVVYYGLCGEKAAQQVTTPTAFKNHFLDMLYEGV